MVGNFVLENIIKYLGYLASGLFICIGFIVTYEVVMRYIFNSPTIWVNEMSRFLQIWATYLALTYSILLYLWLQEPYLVSVMDVFNQELVQSLLSTSLKVWELFLVSKICLPKLE